MNNFREMTPQWLQKKISDFKNMNIFYIALKHVIWRFRMEFIGGSDSLTIFVKFNDFAISRSFLRVVLENSTLAK